jgi:hypothetical protein
VAAQHNAWRAALCQNDHHPLRMWGYDGTSTARLKVRVL